MTHLVFFLEEPSAEEMLKGVLPRLLPDNITWKCVVFEGKQDLEKRLPKRLRAWQTPECRFVVLRDQDSGDCVEIKSQLVDKCVSAGKTDVLVRIACHELESFYLGDLHAVAQAIGPSNVARQQTKAKYRNPDQLCNPFQELKRLAPSYQKVSGSRAIGRYLNLDGNYSPSFNQLIAGIRRLIGANS